MSQNAPGTYGHAADKQRDDLIRRNRAKTINQRTETEAEEIIAEMRKSGRPLPTGQQLRMAMYRLTEGMPVSQAFPGTPKGY
jgi:hypothetical protein